MKAKTVKCTLFLVLALALILPGAYGSEFTVQAASSCFPPPAGLTNWWPGDGNTADIVGGQNAVLVGEATFGEGIVDQSFVLKEEDGMTTVSQSFIDVPDDPEDPVLDLGTGDFTVSLWVYFNDTQDEQVLIEKWIQGVEIHPSYGWTLTKLPENILRLAVDEGAGEIDIDSGVLSIPTHTWLHFAATRKSGMITLYMNGMPVATGAAPLNLDSNSSLKFGHRGNTLDTPGPPPSEDDRGFYLNGRIDEVQLFVGKALNPGLIQAIYRHGSAGLCK
jgi:hypothetical protein